MPERALGRTGLTIGELGFGAAPLGNLYRPVSDGDARRVLDAAWAAGMRYFDTAPYYGFGLSERRLGDFLRGAGRERFVLSTKVGRLLEPDDQADVSAMRHGFCSPMPFRPVYDYTYDGVMRSYEQSLQRLGLSRIDILLVHDIGELTHGDENQGHFRNLIEGGYRALEELRAGGDITAVGLGVNEWEICERAMEYGAYDCFLLAGRYSLLEQTALDSFFGKCAEHGASVIVGGAYNSGILATGVRKGGTPYYNYEPAPRSIIERVAGIEELCDAYGIPLPAAALQFPLAHPCVASVIPGLGEERRIAQTLSLYETDIPEGFWRDMKASAFIREEAPTP